MGFIAHFFDFSDDPVDIRRRGRVVHHDDHSQLLYDPKQGQNPTARSPLAGSAEPRILAKSAGDTSGGGMMEMTF
jgi:hypothetical protein